MNSSILDMNSSILDIKFLCDALHNIFALVLNVCLCIICLLDFFFLFFVCFQNECFPYDLTGVGLCCQRSGSRIFGGKS